MIEIKAVIRPAKLELLRLALRDLPEFPGMSVVKTDGCSAKSKDHAQSTTIKQDLLDYSPKVMIIIVAPDDAVEAICTTIREHAFTGRIGDGLVWTTSIGHAWRIAAGLDAV